MDDTFRKIIRPVDARSSRGVYSRGKPVYRNGSHAPRIGKMSPLARAARRRLKTNGPTRS